jgi:excisionase family DNA binding protein
MKKITKSNYFTTSEAAAVLGFSHSRMRGIVNSGKIKAEKIGKNWIIEKKQLEKVKRQRAAKKKKEEK